MYVKLILPALTEALSPYWRPIKYSLFPPLGLATLAGFLHESDRVTIEDEHVEPLSLAGSERPDLVAIQVYITSAHRAYKLADHYRRLGVHVALGGLHVTSLPDEAALMDKIRAEIKTAPQVALEETEEAERRFGESPMAEERRALAIDALINLQRIGAARSKASSFLERYPNGPYTAHVQAMTGVHVTPAGPEKDKSHTCPCKNP